MRKRITSRTAERLIRAAYEFEYLASVLRDEGYDSEAEEVRGVSLRLGKIGRGLSDDLVKTRD